MAEFDNGYWVYADGTRLPAISGGQDEFGVDTQLPDFGGQSQLFGDVPMSLFGPDQSQFDLLTQLQADLGASGQPQFQLQDFQNLFGFDPQLPNQTSFPQPVLPTSGSQQQAGFLDQLMKNPAQLAGLGITGLGAGLGLIGLFQKLAQGKPVTTQETTRAVAQSTPQEQALYAQALSTLAQLQGVAFNSDLQKTISALARGELNVAPSTVKSVTDAFTQAAGDIAENAIEDARNRGFAGGADLLQSAAAPLASRGLANVHSQVADAILKLGMGMPALAGQLSGQQTQNAMAPMSAIGSLLNFGQQERFNAAPVFQTQTGQSPTLLDSLGPFGQLLGGVGGTLGALSSFGQPTMASVLQEALKSRSLSGNV